MTHPASGAGLGVATGVIVCADRNNPVHRMCDFSTWALLLVGRFKDAPHGRACWDPRHQGDAIHSLAASVPPDCGSDAPASPAALFAAEMIAQASHPRDPLNERTKRGPGRLSEIPSDGRSGTHHPRREKTQFGFLRGNVAC